MLSFTINIKESTLAAWNQAATKAGFPSIVQYIKAAALAGPPDVQLSYPNDKDTVAMISDAKELDGKK